MKVLLYGNCQMFLIANWLGKYAEIIKPKHYGESVEHDWEQDIFFPVSFKDKREVLIKAVHDCDLFLFHHTKNPEFVQSKELYDICAAQKACVTTFYFDAYYQAKNGLSKLLDSVLLNIDTLKSKYSTHKALYGEDCIDMSRWVERNWYKKFITSEERHPTHFYYSDLSKIICDRFSLNGDVKPIELGLHTHKGTKENLDVLKELLPDIEI